MPLRQLDDQDFSFGMVRDVPSWLLKRGELYDALNLIFDRPGVARQRGASLAIFSGAQTAFATSLGWVYSQDGTPIEELYGFNGKSGVVSSVNKTTGVATTVATSFMVGYTIGRPIRHFGFTFFPTAPPAGTSSRLACAVAGQTTSSTFTSATAVVFTQGQQQLTLGGADVTTNIKVGAIIFATDSAANTYWGRVVSIDSSTKFTVWPTPSRTFTTTAAGGLTAQSTRDGGGGICGASFQNRLLWGNTNDLGSTGGTLVTDRRVYYSPLPTETSVAVSTVTYSGATFVNQANYPQLNYFDVPGADPIVAMEPVNDNELLILTSTGPVVFRGNLVTQTSTTTSQVTYDISQINRPYGCLSDLSVQRTPRGIVWAGPNGIYAYDGGEVVDLAEKGRIATLWRGLVRGTSFSIHGAAYVRGHYLISGSSGGSTFGLCCNMTDLQWGRMSGTGTDNFLGAARPTDASAVFAARWWDQAGTAPSMTNGQVIRLESMFNPYTANTTKLDADGVAVTMLLTSRVLDGDSETQKLWARMTVRYAAAMAAASLNVIGQSNIDVAVPLVNVTIGALSSTQIIGISAATNATPIVVTTGATPHGLQTDDYVDIVTATGNTHCNGRWRITVLSSTTFSLNGSSGNGAYAGGGQLRKVTESDFQINTQAQGQGIAFSIQSAAAVDNFELHGFRVAYYERAYAPVMSS